MPFTEEIVALGPIPDLGWRHGLDALRIPAEPKHEGVGDLVDAFDQGKKPQTASTSLRVSAVESPVIIA